MSAKSFSVKQSEALLRVLRRFSAECETDAVIVCDTGGNILAQEDSRDGKGIENVAALAAGSFAATRELSSLIGEPGFKAIVHRGHKSGILMQALGEEHLIVVLFGENSVEGLIRLCLRKMVSQLDSILSDPEAAGETGEEANTFEVHEKQDSNS